MRINPRSWRTCSKYSVSDSGSFAHRNAREHGCLTIAAEDPLVGVCVVVQSDYERIFRSTGDILRCTVVVID
jgi:hypothetical protein